MKSKPNRFIFANNFTSEITNKLILPRKKSSWQSPNHAPPTAKNQFIATADVFDLTAPLFGSSSILLDLIFHAMKIVVTDFISQNASIKKMSE